MNQVVSAVFDTNDEARDAVRELRAAGVPDDAISIVARGAAGRDLDDGGQADITDTDHSNVLRGILGGGALGAGLGIAALAIPGVGPLVAAGAIAASAVPAAAAIGGAAGAAAGTLNETLAKHGVGEDDARYYGERIGAGGVFISVDAGRADVDPAALRDLLHRFGGHDSTRSRAAAL